MVTKSRDIDYYMSLPYRVEIKHDEDGYFAKFIELPGCMTWTESFAELEGMIEDAKRGWIEDALEHGDAVPEPRSTEDYSGKLNLRMPKSLHRDLVRKAEEEGVSLNQLMVANLARSVNEIRRRLPSEKAAEDMAKLYDYALKHPEEVEIHVRGEVLAELVERSNLTADQAVGRSEASSEQAMER